MLQLSSHLELTANSTIFFTCNGWVLHLIENLISIEKDGKKHFL